MQDSHICKCEGICVAQESTIGISMMVSVSKTDCKFDVDLHSFLIPLPLLSRTPNLKVFVK